ncbi:hypothetical protein GIB67_030866 [Kingdonia uniflora]|uniref:Uncharacterized protein n=1 Tax=Kingdonia uniflora TaxID=39325 RepID=A0A7J7L3F3_9MAGN|nr:hypothetical protein GIB67_030866 [Kingdonia uniflora]
MRVVVMMERWLYSSVVRVKLDSTVDSYSDTEGQTWNDNIIWVKGNYLQRDDEEPLDLRFRTIKQSVKSSVERKESLLDKVAEEKTELELVLEGFGLSRQKRVDSRLNKVARLVKGIWLGIEEEEKRWMPLRRTPMLRRKMRRKRKWKHRDHGRSGWYFLPDVYLSGDNVELPEGGSEKVELDSSHSREDDVLMCNREFAEQFDWMKEANENREVQYVKAHFRLMELTQAISDLALQIEEKDSEIKKGVKELVEGNVQKGNANLREFRHKLDTSLIREKVLKGVIKAKESLVKRKEELLKDMSAREELNAEIGRLRARVVDLEAMNLVESAKYIKMLEENQIYYANFDTEMTEQKNNYARLESRLKKVRARFVTMVIPDTSRSDLLKAIVAYFAEEVKKT